MSAQPRPVAARTEVVENCGVRVEFDEAAQRQVLEFDVFSYVLGATGPQGQPLAVLVKTFRFPIPVDVADRLGRMLQGEEVPPAIQIARVAPPPPSNGDKRTGR